LHQPLCQCQHRTSLNRGVTIARTSFATPEMASSLWCATFARMTASCNPTRGARPPSARSRSATQPLYCTSLPAVASIARRTRPTAPRDTACRAAPPSFIKAQSNNKQTFCTPPCDGWLSMSPPTSCIAPARTCAAAPSELPEQRTTTTQAKAAAGGSLRNLRMAFITAMGREDAATRASAFASAGGASHETSRARATSTSSLLAAGCSRTALTQCKTHSDGPEASSTARSAEASGNDLSAGGGNGTDKDPLRGRCHALPLLPCAATRECVELLLVPLVSGTLLRAKVASAAIRVGRF